MFRAPGLDNLSCKEVTGRVLLTLVHCSKLTPVRCYSGTVVRCYSVQCYSVKRCYSVSVSAVLQCYSVTVLRCKGVTPTV